MQAIVLAYVRCKADLVYSYNCRHQMSPLLYAAKIGRSRVVEKLIDLGANINKQDNRGYTVLCFARFFFCWLINTTFVFDIVN